MVTKRHSWLCQFEKCDNSKTLLYYASLTKLVTQRHFPLCFFDKSSDLMTLFHDARLTKRWLKCTSVLCQYDKMVTKTHLHYSSFTKIVTQDTFALCHFEKSGDSVWGKWCLKRLCIMPGWEKWWLKDTSALCQFNKSGDSNRLLHYSSLEKVVIQWHTCIFIMPVWQ